MPLIQVAMPILMLKMAETEQDSINKLEMSLIEENLVRLLRELASSKRLMPVLEINSWLSSLGLEQ
jgi:hypothetical protein